MPWIRLDDQFPDHPKIAAVGPMASWLYVCGIGYCNRLLTDGVIPAGQVRKLADVDDAPALAARLVESGLWEEVEGGYRVHDYLDYQPSAEHVLAERADNARRQQEWRDRNKGGGNSGRNNVTNTATETVTHAPNNAPVTPAPYPSRTHPDPPTDGEVRGVRNVGGGAASAPKRRGKRAETPAPDSFPITDDLTAWADETVPEIDLERETERFLHSARAKGRTYANWESAWKGWMTNNFPKALKTGVLGRPAPPGTARASPDLAAQQPRRTQRNIEVLRRLRDETDGIPGPPPDPGGSNQDRPE